MIERTPHFSYSTGKLARGCQLCVSGCKTVVFVTGVCSKSCYYCPISDAKRGKDDVWANEWKVDNLNQVIEEARLCVAKGAGLTGGDPLARLDRSVKLIKMLKKEFGDEFHIHLYTPLELVTSSSLNALYSAGLDEIRFHPDIETEKLWSRIELAKEFDWSVGVEIPAIPGKLAETKKLIDYLSGKIDFLNINELEVSDTNGNELLKRGFKPKDEISYGIFGSEEMALKLLKYGDEKIGSIHYCTATLKDKVQLSNRIKRRAKNIAKDYDMVNFEGMLKRGAIYLPEIKPGFGYRNKLESIKKDSLVKITQKLKKIRNQIKDELHIPDNLIEIDSYKLRILIDSKVLNHTKDKIKSLGLIPAIVEEYPTHDQMEVSVEFL